MKILIRGGRVLDPATGTDAVIDLFLENGRISKRGTDLQEAAERVINASGCYVLPGLIDLHVHLREPGLEHKETIRTGGEAAARGGFTTICPMPNTKPATDSPEMIGYVREKAETDAPVHVLPYGAVTAGQKGEKLADIAGMAKAGAVGISEDGKSVMNSALYRKGMREAAKAGIPVMAHCEDIDLVEGGCINDGEKSRELGLPGISNSVEDVITARDILLAKETGARLHLCHVSTADSVKMIREAKREGLQVTAEVCPHHFTLTEDDIPSANSNFKMNPPVRGEADRQALIGGLQDGTIDAIATDHAPHHADEKAKPITEAPFGIVGSETAVALTITQLVEPGILTPMQMAERMSLAPARILGIDKGSLEEGKCADVTVIDPAAEYVIDPSQFASKGKNTPFAGWKVRGKVVATIVDGNVVYQA